MHFFPYGWLLLAGIAVSLFTWTRLARGDARLVPKLDILPLK